jgi:hypothetical protein
MKQYKRYNSIFGWAAFLIAAITYISTSEATASLWDCGEFIATSFKLEVGHPPGNPMFALMARFFTLFAGSNLGMVARMVNYMSALASAFTILLLFWTITHLARKIIIKNGNYSKSNIAIIIGSGLVGSLAYTFSDTFWFSAVEGEVYASSSLFTALVFWAILKWEDVADEKYSNRWIVLIAYLMGLSIGVHLLNLLAIPAIVMVYYFRKFKTSWNGAIIALSLSIVILAVVMYGIIQGAVLSASWVELFFVNSLGLPFNSGIVFYILLILITLVYGIYYSIKKQKVILNTIFLGISMLLLGYSSYTIVVIRASADTPINEDKPNNVFSLQYYINREQYGDRPLLYGQYYCAPMTDVVEDKPTYLPGKEKYEIVGHGYKAIFDSRFKGFFPRMYSTDRNHIEVYKDWGNVKGTPIEVANNGKTNTVFCPTFGENLQFFFKYQLGHMYMRYFLWNFAGRQNDEQGSGGILKGNWISGINYIDAMRLGPQDKLPPSLKDIPSRNVYYFLPFILGILGLIFMLDRSKRDFLVTVLLFFMTGIAIVIYLNQTPYQPRERDYAYAGSFYVFAIWIGLGVMSIYELIKHEKTALLRAIVISVFCLLIVPGIMAKENWHDHDRSGRYTTRAYAYNYLNSCAPNAILFTYGDNDTFPLWYLQEVEGIRTDVRVVNTMLFSMDWYFDQMKKKAYESDPLPISLTNDKYVGEKRNRVYIVEKIKKYIELKQALEFVASDNPDTKTISGYDQQLDFLPGRNFFIPIDKKQVLANGTVEPRDSKLITDTIKFTIKGSSIEKSQLGILNIIANNNWKRPIYFVACNNEGTVGLDEYMQCEGFAYRLVPVKTKFSNALDCGRIKTEIMYNNMMNKFDYGRMEAPDVYMDEFHKRTLSVLRFKTQFVRLANSLLAEHKKDSAIKVLDKCRQLTPSYKIPNDMFTIGIADSYYAAGDKAKGLEVLKEYSNTCSEELTYFFSLRPGFQGLIDYEIRYNLEAMRQMHEVAVKYKDKFEIELGEKFKHLSSIYESNQQVLNKAN